MTFSRKPLSNRLRDANPLLRTEIMAQLATSPHATQREALAQALAGFTNTFGARTTVDHLSRDENDDVRAAAIRTATMRVDSHDSYQNILLKACHDSCVKVRHLAISGLQKGIHRGIVKNVATPLVHCVRSSSPATQVYALDALDELAHVYPPSAFTAYQELIEQPSILGAPVVPRLLRQLKRLEALFPLRARTMSSHLRKHQLKTPRAPIGATNVTRCVDMTQVRD